MRNENWVICCPGPSLWRIDTVARILHSDFESIVAVNGAITFSMYLPITYWALQDIEVFDTIINKSSGSICASPCLWVPSRWPQELRDQYHHLSLEDIFKRFQSEFIPGGNDQYGLGAVMPFGRNIRWTEFTVFAAIAMAVLHGARTINIYGADMAGRGYGKPGLENERMRHDEQRWQEERAGMKQIVEACGQNGIDIIIHTSEGSPLVL